MLNSIRRNTYAEFCTPTKNILKIPNTYNFLDALLKLNDGIMNDENYYTYIYKTHGTQYAEH